MMSRKNLISRRDKSKRYAFKTNKSVSFFVVPPIAFSVSEWFTQYGAEPFDWHHPCAISATFHDTVMSEHEGDHQEQIEGDVATTLEFSRPPFYAVVLFNDDYTPMEFVILVLQQYFGLDLDRATEVMLSVHYEGKGVAGVYPRDIAETKAQLVNRHARVQGHPLLCQIEPQEI
jgi:ATP-dependent Clp protease adaptor protein ClpS